MRKVSLVILFMAMASIVMGQSLGNVPGSGVGVYKGDAKFKRLKAGNNVTITDQGDSVKIEATSSGVTAADVHDSVATKCDSLKNSNDSIFCKKNNVWRFQYKQNAAGGSGSVTTASVVTANGFAGTVANATTTPAITITTSVTGLLKGNGAAISAASAGDVPTLNQNTTGSAASLTTSRTIYGNAFNGTANVSGNVTIDSTIISIGNMRFRVAGTEWGGFIGNSIYLGWQAGALYGTRNSYNTGIGPNSMGAANCFNSTALGFASLSNSSGDNNVGLGFLSGASNTGDHIVSIGRFAAYNNTYDFIVALGDSAIPTADYQLCVSDTITHIHAKLNGGQAGYTLLNDGSNNGTWQPNFSFNRDTVVIIASIAQNDTIPDGYTGFVFSDGGFATDEIITLPPSPFDGQRILLSNYNVIFNSISLDGNGAGVFHGSETRILAGLMSGSGQYILSYSESIGGWY